MEEELLAETVCEVAGEVPWRKVLARGRGAVTELSKKTSGGAPHDAVGRKADATRTSEARMEGFNETDAANLQRVKDAMAERATGGGLVSGPDAAAAVAFAALLDAETRREDLRLKSVGQEKAPAAVPSASWTESVGNRSGNGEALAAVA